MQDTKKVAGELLVELEKKGVTFETVDGKLKYKDSKGNFTENSKEKVKKYKEEIIEILKKKQTIDEFITDNDYETNVYPLTDVQAAYLVGKTEAVKWGGIGCKGYIEVDFGSYSAEELSRAWKVLVNRHEMLRAKVTEVGFEILERDEIDYEIKIVNLQKMAEREKVDTLSKIREDFSEYVFHTEEPPLFKVLITKRIEGNFFHLLVDLIVSDFASVQLLISEMGELLKGASLEKIRYTAIVGSGIFPGLSGWMLSSVLKEAFNDDLIEMIIGGVYNFSKAAAIDYVEEIKSYKAGIPMACVRNGKILPAQKRSPLNLPTRISKLSILPYVTEEIQEIIQGKYMLNIDSYTAAPVSLFSIVNKAHCQKKDLVNALMGQKNSNQKAFIWVRQNKGNDSRCIYFEGKNPSVLTGEILAITANAIFEMPRKDGIYTMASYLEKYQVLDELKKIDKFKSEGKI